jgi:predicted signal transduction protein with EAL and GGDEF domain
MNYCDVPTRRCIRPSRQTTTLRFFDSALQEAVEAWSTVESDLRKAVVKDQFLLHCQVHVNPSCLKRSPLDQLKIDQFFVRDILTGANDAVIA